MGVEDANDVDETAHFDYYISYSESGVGYVIPAYTTISVRDNDNGSLTMDVDGNEYPSITISTRKHGQG